MIFRQLFDSASSTYSYLLASRCGGEALLIDPAVLAHDRDAAGAIAQRAKAGDVIGVKVRIHCLHQIELEFLHQAQIAVHPLQHWPPLRLAST